MWLNPRFDQTEPDNGRDYNASAERGKNETALCSDVAKGGSKQGGSHGDRCVRK